MKLWQRSHPQQRDGVVLEMCADQIFSEAVFRKKTRRYLEKVPEFVFPSKFSLTKLQANQTKGLILRFLTSQI